MENNLYRLHKESSCACIAALLGITFLSGCATTKGMASDTQESKVEQAVTDHKETAIGAVLLSGIGAGLGYAFGGKDGAAIGAGAGAVIGAGIGHLFERKDRERTETVSEVGYRPETDERQTAEEPSDSGETDKENVSHEAVEVAYAGQPVQDVTDIKDSVGEGTHVTEAYQIINAGHVVGSLTLVESPSSMSSSSNHGGSLLICPHNAPGSCAMLELRRQ